MDPRIASLDIESYGKIPGMPAQTVFAPRRSLLVDGAKIPELAVTCSLTIPKEDPRWKSTSGVVRVAVGNVTPTSAQTAGWDAHRLSQLRPGPTMVLDLRRASHFRILQAWLLHLDSLQGMNLPYDLAYLRARSPILKEILQPFKLLLIDLSYINFLQCESRPERSLKDIGPVLGTHIYREEDLAPKLKTFSEVITYNACDTVNTTLGISALAQRIHQDPLPSDKLSPWCLQFYSDTLWCCVQMSEHGVPFHRPSLEKLLVRANRTMERCEKAAATLGVILKGTGSNKSKNTLLTNIYQEVTSCRSLENLEPPKPSTPLETTSKSASSSAASSSSPSAAPPMSSSLDLLSLLELTEKKRALSFSDHNLTIFQVLLPQAHPLQRHIRLCLRHAKASKLAGSYLMPLLLHRTKLKENRVDRSSILVPQPGVKPPWKFPPPPLIHPKPPKPAKRSKTASKRRSKKASKASDPSPVPSP